MYCVSQNYFPPDEKYFVAELSVSLGASLLSPVLLRSSDTESIKSESSGAGPPTKRRRLSVSSQEMLEQLAQLEQVPRPLVPPSPGHAHLHPRSPGHGHQHHTR